MEVARTGHPRARHPTQARVLRVRLHRESHLPPALRVLTLALLLSGAACDLENEPPPDAGTETPGGDDGGVEGEAWLAAHNEVRAQASPAPVPALTPFTWSARAASIAKAWAENCRFEHNPGRGDDMGENLYATTRASDTPLLVVKAWASEAPDYDYASNTCASGKVCGHYTALVWRDTRQVGCASARCTRNSPFAVSTWYHWVCNYTPPGNFVGERPY